MLSISMFVTTGMMWIRRLKHESRILMVEESMDFAIRSDVGYSLSVITRQVECFSAINTL